MKSAGKIPAKESAAPKAAEAASPQTSAAKDAPKTPTPGPLWMHLAFAQARRSPGSDPVGEPGDGGSNLHARDASPGGVGRGVLQAKLVVGQREDPLEHEADRIADTVLRMPEPTSSGDEPKHPSSSSAAVVNGRLQRQCAACEKDHDEGRVQRRAGREGAGDTGEAPPVVGETLRSGRGRPLDTETRAYFEPRFGRDFSGVRVHTDERASASARSVSALAYTVGPDIVFAAGRYAPAAPEGRRLLAHELTHVVQQTSAAARPGALAVQRAPASVLRRKEQPSEMRLRQVLAGSLGKPDHAAAAVLEIKGWSSDPLSTVVTDANLATAVEGAYAKLQAVLRKAGFAKMPVGTMRLAATSSLDAAALTKVQTIADAHTWTVTIYRTASATSVSATSVVAEKRVTPSKAAAAAPAAAKAEPKKKPAAEIITGRRAKVTSPTTVSKKPSGDAANVLGQGNFLVVGTPLEVTGEAIPIAGSSNRSWIPITVRGDGPYKDKPGYVLSDTVKLEAAPVKEDAEAKAKEEEAKRLAAEKTAAEELTAGVAEAVKKGDFAGAYLKLDAQSMHQMIMALDGLALDVLISLKSNLRSPATDGRFRKRLLAAISVVGIGKGGSFDEAEIVNALEAIRATDPIKEQKTQILNYLQAHPSDAAASLKNKIEYPTAGMYIRTSAKGPVLLGTTIQYVAENVPVTTEGRGNVSFYFGLNDGRTLRYGDSGPGAGVNAGKKEGNSWTFTWQEVGEYRIEAHSGPHRAVYLQDVVAADEKNSPMSRAFEANRIPLTVEDWQEQFGTTQQNAKGPLTSSANPAVASANSAIEFQIIPTEATKSFFWYVIPSDLSGYTELEGLEETTYREMLVLASSATGSNMSLICAQPRTLTVLCEERDADGNEIRTSAVRQAVQQKRETKDDEEFVAEVNEAMNKLADETSPDGTGTKKGVPVRAVFVFKRGGATIPLRLFIGPAKSGNGLILIDVQPGINHREFPGKTTANCFDKFADEHSYPEGQVRVEVLAKPEWNVDALERTLELKKSKWETVAELLGHAAAVTMFIAPPLAAVLQIASSGINVALNYSSGKILERKMAIDVMTMAASFLPLGGSIKNAAKTVGLAIPGWVSKGAHYAGVGINVADGVVITYDGLELLAKVNADSSKSNAEKTAEMAHILFNLVAHLGMMAIFIAGSAKKGSGGLEGSSAQEPSVMSVEEALTTLGLNRAATPKEIRKAFRIRAAQNHPDTVARESPARRTQAAKEYQALNDAKQALQKHGLWDDVTPGGAPANQGASGGQGAGRVPAQLPEGAPPAPAGRALTGKQSEALFGKVSPPNRGLNAAYSPFPSADIDFYKRMGLEPKTALEIGGRKIYVSEPYNMGKGRVGLVAYIEHEGHVYIRSFYRSNSRGLFQSAAGHGQPYNPGWIDKGIGDGKFSTVLPIDAQEQLNKLLSGGARDLPALSGAEATYKGNPVSAANKAFYGPLEYMALDHQNSSYGRALAGGNHDIPLVSAEPIANSKIAKPDSITLIDAKLAPDFSKPIKTFDVQLDATLYPKPVKAHVFNSVNGELQYLFFSDGEKVWLGQVDNIASPVNSFGVRMNSYNPANLAIAPVEYSSDMTPPGYGRSDAARFVGDYQSYNDVVGYHDQVKLLREAKKAILGK